MPHVSGSALTRMSSRSFTVYQDCSRARTGRGPQIFRVHAHDAAARRDGIAPNGLSSSDEAGLHCASKTTDSDPTGTGCPIFTLR